MRYIFLLMLMISCSPIKRHSRIVRKYPFVHTTDSVKLIDTIFVQTNAVYYDTVVQDNLLFDTIILEKENLKVEVFRVKDSVYINGKCDTIFVDKVVERTIPVRYFKEKNKINLTLLIWLISLVLLIIFYVLNKLK